MSFKCHTVITKISFLEVYDELKQVGAEGYLVCPIEKNGSLILISE